MGNDTPSFLADAMLHGLTRWLRVLGYDTASYPEKDDAELVRLAAHQRRIFLTRDRRLIEELRPDNALFIEADKPLQQLREVIDACALECPKTLFTRCLMCNTPVGPASTEQIRRLPAQTRRMPGPFCACPDCGRVYWPGSHTRRMRRALARALPHWFGVDEGETRR